MNSQTPFPSNGHAAYDVLTSDEIFRQIVAWSAGWPGLFIGRDAHAARKDLGRSTVAIDLTRVRDLRTLRIVCTARWYVANTLTTFRFTGVDQLIRNADGTALRLVFDAMRACAPLSASEAFYFKYYYWSLAVNHYAGRCDVLEALRLIAPPLVVDEAARTFNGDYVTEIRHPDVAQWFVETYGAAVLPKTLIQTAAERGRRALFYYLLRVQGQDVNIDAAVLYTEQRHLLTLLVQCRNGGASGCATEVLTHAMKLLDVELIRLLLFDIAPFCEKDMVEKANELVKTTRSTSKAITLPPVAEAWEDPFDATTLEPKQAPGGVGGWLRGRADRVGRWFSDRCSSVDLYIQSHFSREMADEDV